MKTHIIKIAEDFTKYPAGRFLSDGNFSGERFREDFLVPTLKEYDKVIIFLDGVKGYGSSFLEETFGGLIREKHFTKEEVHKKLEIQFEDKTLNTYETEIWDYIDDAG